MRSLLALLFPPSALLAILWWPGIDVVHLPALNAPHVWPGQLWIVAIFGSIATLAGFLDWHYHHHGGRKVPLAERKLEQSALLMGIPLFGLLSAASIMVEPTPLLLPIIVVIGIMANLVLKDEITFHQKCSDYETLLHRLLVGGNSVAALAWLHWCFLGAFRHG